MIIDVHASSALASQPAPASASCRLGTTSRRRCDSLCLRKFSTILPPPALLSSLSSSEEETADAISEADAEALPSFAAGALPAAAHRQQNTLERTRYRRHSCARAYSSALAGCVLPLAVVRHWGQTALAAPATHSTRVASFLSYYRLAPLFIDNHKIA